MDTPAYLFPEIWKWLLILPILNRLYTSVIVLDPENNGPEVSWSTDLSPTTTLWLGADRWHTACMSTWWGRGVPGVWDGWGPEGAIPVPSPHHPQDPYLDIFSHKALPTAK